MPEISFSSILDGVSLALHTAFPAPVQIHGGGAQQELKAGDFNVVLSGAGHCQEVGRRYKRTPAVDVSYCLHEDTTECYDVADKLAAVLESITTPEGDVIHATGCTWSVIDGVLHMLLAYDHFVYRPREEIMMGELKIDQKG